MADQYQEEEKNNEAKEGVDAFEDLNINNINLMSEAHFGTQKLQEIMKNDKKNRQRKILCCFLQNIGSSNFRLLLVL